MRLAAETRWMHIGPRAGEQHAVDHIKQRSNVRQPRRAGKHQRQRAGDLCYCPKVAFTDGLRGKPLLDPVRISNHTDHWPVHCKVLVPTLGARRPRESRP